MNVSYVEGKVYRCLTSGKARKYCMKKEPPRIEFYRYCSEKGVWFNFFRLKGLEKR